VRGFINEDRTYIQSPETLEGVVIGGRLAVIYSLKDYRDFWAGRLDLLQRHVAGYGYETGERQFQFGVNLLVFALTQEGGIAKRLVARRQ